MSHGVALLRQNTTSFEYKKSPALSRRACFILKPGSDLLYRLHPCRRPYGLASLIQKRSRRFCHSVQVGHIVKPQITKKATPIGVAFSIILKPGSDLLSHGNSHTIIGDALFHCCVRDGNRWFQSSMAARHNLVLIFISVFGKRSGNNARSIIKSSRSLM